MVQLKAIDTFYADHYFRSRLEARWAVYFDALGIKWLYEDEGYVLPNGEWYLPDFYLPEYDTHVEIKPDLFGHLFEDYLGQDLNDSPSSELNKIQTFLGDYENKWFPFSLTKKLWVRFGLPNDHPGYILWGDDGKFNYGRFGFSAVERTIDDYLNGLPDGTVRYTSYPRMGDYNFTDLDTLVQKRGELNPLDYISAFTPCPYSQYVYMPDRGFWWADDFTSTLLQGCDKHNNAKFQAKSARF